MSRSVEVRLHVYQDLVARSGHRDVVTSVGGNPECTSGADVVAALEDLIRDGEPLFSGLAIIRNGRPITRAELCEIDVDAGDEFHAAWRPGEITTTTVVLAILSIAASAASVLLAPRAPRPTGTSEPPQKRYGFNRFSNDAFVGDVIPVVYGRRRRYGGKVIAKIPVESSTGDGDAKLRMLICLGHGEIQSIGTQTADFDREAGGPGTALDGIYLNDQPLSNFNGVLASGRMGATGQAVLPGFTDVETLREVGVGGVELRNTSGSDRTGGDASGEAFTFTTNDVNAVVARVFFPTGLYTIATSGQVDTRRVKYRYRWRISAGPGSWSAWTVVDLQKAEQSEFFSAPRLDELADPAEPVDVQLERVTAESSSAADVDRMVWDSLIEVQYSSRTYDGFAMLAVELTANEQLQGVPRVSVDMKGRKVRVWDGISDPNAPTFNVEYTENPVWHALDWMTSTVYGMGASYDDDRVDMAGLCDASQYCDEEVERYPIGGGVMRPRFRFHYALDEPRDGVEWLRTICRAFRCVPVLAGGVWRFPIDRPQSSAVEIFTDATWAVDEAGIAKVSYTREFTMRGLTRPNRFLCQFENELVEGQPDAIAYPEYGEFWLGGLDPETVREEAIKLDGVTDPDQVMAELVYLMNRNRFLSRSIRGTSTKPVVVAQPGDRFDAAISMVGWGLASGRVAAGCTQQELRLDKTVTLLASKSYVISLYALADSAVYTYTVDPLGADTTFPAGTPIEVDAPNSYTPVEFDEYSLGEVGIQFKPFTCTAVKLLDAGTLEWEIEGIEYDTGVYTLTPGPINLPPYSGLPSGSTPPGPVVDLRGFDRVVNGIRQVVLSWSQTMADAEITATFRVYRRRLGTTAWVLTPIPHIGLRGAVFEIGDQSTAYEFAVVAVSYGGAFLSPYDPRVPTVSIVFGLGVPPPPPPSAVTPTNTGGNTYTLSWDPVEDAVGYQVIAGVLTGDAVKHCLIVARTIDPELTGLELSPSEDTVFWVRSIGINGRLSFTATDCTVTAAIPGGSSIKQAVTLDSGTGGASLSNASWVTVGSEDWLRMTTPGSPATITFAAEDSGSLTASELTILPITRNDHEDPPMDTDPSPFTIPSIAADQWGIVSVGPPVVGMLMPPWPDNEQAWLFEIRLHDGGSWGPWEALALGEAVGGTFQQWQLRATMSRDDYPYRPALLQVTVVITH